MDETSEPGLFETNLRSLPLIARGKVRDNYAVGTDRILMVATDRLSAFDVVMNEPIPGKGKVLTEMALFWFDKLKHIVPNHLTGEDPESVVAEDERELIRGRSMLVKRLKPLPIEAVVRGYLAGSAWKEYQSTGSVCGIALPPGLQIASKLPAPIFTPATKAEMGSHDENIDFERMSLLVGAYVAAAVRRHAIRLYVDAAEFALDRGIILADSKFEFGLDGTGAVVLMDEILTPDSSRFWPKETYVTGSSPNSLDKQVVRDWLEKKASDGSRWNKTPPPPSIPKSVIYQVSLTYKRVLERLTGTRKARKARILQNLNTRLIEAVDLSQKRAILAEMSMYHSRCGNVSEAKQILQELIQYPTAKLRETVWKNLAEAIFDQYEADGSKALDKVRRAHILSRTGSDFDLQALTAAWMAQLHREIGNYEAVKDFILEVMQYSTAATQSAISRACLVTGDMLLIADKDDLAAIWHTCARAAALEEGDDATLGALAFNIALIRVSKFRQAVLQRNLLLPATAAAALVFTKSAESLEQLLGNEAMADLGHLQRAQALSLNNQAHLALPILLAFAEQANSCSAERMRAEWNSDLAWCYARLGENKEAIYWAGQTVASIKPEMHVDDVAATHSRLARVYSHLGDHERTKLHSTAATAAWQLYDSLKEKLVQLFEGIPRPEHLSGLPGSARGWK